MLSLFKRLLGGRTEEVADAGEVTIPATVWPDTFWRPDAQLPIPDWQAVETRAPAHDAPGADHDAYWRDAALIWLTRLGDAFGSDYRVSTSENFALLAALSSRESRSTLDFAERSRRRILRTLADVASADGHGPTLILVFDTPDDYYAYIDHYYPSEGVFAMSAGVFIDAGYGHFAFMADDLSQMEPVLVHELTHALLRHLALPRWLDEGAAVNMEKHLLPSTADPRRNLYSAHEMADKHARFWNAQTIQEFWTGHSFLRPDDGNLLSYDLAERLTQLLGRDYPRYAALLRAARADDGGIAALHDAFGLAPGDVAADVLGPGPWQAQPASWDSIEAQAVSRAQQLAQALPAADTDTERISPDRA